MLGVLKKFKKCLVLDILGTIHSGLMSKGFPTQEGEGGGNEVYLGLPCGRQKLKQNLQSTKKTRQLDLSLIAGQVSKSLIFWTFGL